MIDVNSKEISLPRQVTASLICVHSWAAALMESLAIHHPFVDGDKRIAFAAADAGSKNLQPWTHRPPGCVVFQCRTNGYMDIAYPYQDQACRAHRPKREVFWVYRVGANSTIDILMLLNDSMDMQRRYLPIAKELPRQSFFVLNSSF